MNILAGLELARVPRVPGTQFWTSPLAPADFEVLNTNWHPQSSFYVTSGTLGFKFLAQALYNINKFIGIFERQEFLLKNREIISTW